MFSTILTSLFRELSMCEWVRRFLGGSPSAPWNDLARFHTLLPYEAYEEESGLFYNADATGFVLKGEPLAGASLQDQGQLAEFFRQKEHLPEGSSLQVLLVASPRIDPFLDTWSRARQEAIYQKLAQQRVSLFRDKAQGLIAPPVFTYHLLISLTFPGWVTDPVNKEHVLQTRNALEQSLGNIGISTYRLDAEDFLHEMRNLLNVTGSLTNESRCWNPHESLARQILAADQCFDVDEEGVRNGGAIWRSYVPKSSPKMWALPHMDRFLGDALSREGGMVCPFWLHYGLTIDQNQSRAKAKVVMRRESLENSMKNKLTKWMGGLPEQHEEADSCLKELNQGERIVFAGLSLMVMTSPQNLPKVESRVRQIWTACGWEASPATYDHLPMLLASLPMTWTMGRERSWTGTFQKELSGFGRDLARMGKAKKTITREAQNLLPLLGEWKGQGAPGMLLYGRRGQVFMWNPFSTALLPRTQHKDSHGQTDHNYNVCIAGQSGSGKSVFMQELMVSILGVGGRVFVLDYGRSFKKTCHLLGGQHIECDVRNPMSLNPFTAIPTGESAEDRAIREETLATLKPILQVMAAPKQGTSDLQNAVLERALRQAWMSEGHNASIDHIHQGLMDMKETYAHDLAHMLYPFTQGGVYGSFFRGPCTAQLNARLVVIETDHLRNHPDLMAVLVQMMILQINQTMARGDRQQPFLIMIDEAWKLLTGKDTARFISEVTRTARKYKGGLVLGTQHLKDYFNEASPAATEAFNCSTWKCLLYQEADAIRGLRHHPQLGSFIGNEFQESLLCSLRSQPPHYSEVAVYGAGLQGVVGRLSLDPFSRLLYSTNPTEYEAVEKQLAAGCSIEEAIERVLDSQKMDA